MKKTMLSRIMLLVGCFLLSFSMVTPVHATAGGQGGIMLSVNPKGPVDGIGVFKTIEEAILAANDFKTEDVIHVYVYPGTYDVQKIDATCDGVVEIKKNVSIVGVPETGWVDLNKKDPLVTITSSAAHNDDDSVFVASGKFSFNFIHIITPENNKNMIHYTAKKADDFFNMGNSFLELNPKLENQAKAKVGPSILCEGDLGKIEFMDNEFTNSSIKINGKLNKPTCKIASNRFIGSSENERGEVSDATIEIANPNSGVLKKEAFEFRSNAFMNIKEQAIKFDYKDGGELNVSENYWGQNPDFTKLFVSGKLGTILNNHYYIDPAFETGDSDVTAFSINKQELSLPRYSSEKLITTITAGPRFDGYISWNSDNPSIADIDENGVITAYKNGTANIFGMAKYKSVQCKVTVINPIVDGKATVIETKKEDGIKITLPKAEEAKETINASINELLSNVDETTAIDSTTKDNLTNALKKGEKIDSEVRIEVIKKDTIKEEVKAMEKTLKGNETIGAYLDLNVMLTANGADIGKLNELTAPITFTVKIPEELIQSNREYFIVTIHNGVAKKIPATLKDGQLTFSTAAFSTYAIAYETIEKKATPNTADTSMSIIFGTCLLMALGSAWIAIKKSKEI
ncbi:MAG: Ig-like domain-containing protein [Erysipelotrichaceae bacterium]